MTREFKTITLLYIVKITFNAITHWSTLNILLVAPGKKNKTKKLYSKKHYEQRTVSTSQPHVVIMLLQ